MSDTLAKIQKVIDEHKITGDPYEIPFPVSEFHPSGRCYQFLLGQDQRYEIFRVYTGVSVDKHEVSLASALWNLVDDAEHHSGYYETFERWLRENDDYVALLGSQEAAEMLYKEARDTYLGLKRVLDTSTYDALVEAVGH